MDRLSNRFYCRSTPVGVPTFAKLKRRAAALQNSEQVLFKIGRVSNPSFFTSKTFAECQST
ncbi:hypothetical protein BUQ74_06935 [Leptospira weilii serovar Heyan]|nr:hypothetical protein BUQ74_06935 [Leptospira weilii serovar Heyan]